MDPSPIVFLLQAVAGIRIVNLRLAGKMIPIGQLDLDEKRFQANHNFARVPPGSRLEVTRALARELGHDLEVRVAAWIVRR